MVHVEGHPAPTGGTYTTLDIPSEWQYKGRDTSTTDADGQLTEAGWAWVFSKKYETKYDVATEDPTVEDGKIRFRDRSKKVEEGEFPQKWGNSRDAFLAALDAYEVEPMQPQQFGDDISLEYDFDDLPFTVVTVGPGGAFTFIDKKDELPPGASRLDRKSVV